jgi:AraC-like DNA-binding protein/mannose-6-phosphate isomerase-like protein (cupin superfamily)
MSKENVEYNLKSTNIKIYNLTLSTHPTKTYRGEHFHKEAELLLVLSGRMGLLIDDKEITLTDGQSAYIGMNSIHRIIPIENDSKILIIQSPIGDKREGELGYISDANLRSYILAHRTEPYALFLEKGNEFSRILYKIEEEYSTRCECYEAYIQGYLQIIVGFLGRNSIISYYDGTENMSAIKKIEPIAAYVSENYMNHITLDALSEEVKYDKYYICKLIKNSLNTTFTEYLNYVRLQNAERLLFSTDMPISDVVYETGFSTPQNFFKVFKASYGYTPHKYRTLYNPSEIV